MPTQLGLEKLTPFINSERKPWTTPLLSLGQNASPLSITVSRQTGSGALVIANSLADYLQLCSPAPAPRWAVFDRNLAQQVLEDHHLPTRFTRFMPEDRTSEVADVLDELLAAHPPSSVFVQQTAETILRLAERGHVIVIGRGASIITSHLKSVFHVRLAASLDKRVERIRQAFGLSSKAAMELILREDRGRQRYIKKYFDRNIDDPHLYHLVINTDLIPYESAAKLICDSALKMASQTNASPLNRLV